MVWSDSDSVRFPNIAGLSRARNAVGPTGPSESPKNGLHYHDKFTVV